MSGFAENTAIGDSALFNNTIGNNNTAIGGAALKNNTTGTDNTAIGFDALIGATGGDNIGVGFEAGSNLTTGDSNIDIGNQGVAGEADIIRIGTSTVQTQTFIAGISGVTTGCTATAVVVDTNGQLGTVSSSRRFKYDIQDMSEASGDLWKLRPVTFRYKQAQNGGGHPLQYGLVGEEVADV